MQQDLVHKVKSNPKYHELVSSRSKFAWIMSVLMLVIYYAFILTIAFNKSLMATPLSQNSTMTIGIPIGLPMPIAATWRL